MLEEDYSYKVIIKEFERRREVNSQYSLRAYARNLGVSPGILSQILNKKREITPKILSQIAPRLNIDSDTLSKMLNTQKKLKASRSIKNIDNEEIVNIDMETFSVISDWYYYPILELFNIYSEINGELISDKLGLRTCVAEKALDNLLKVRLLRIDSCGNYELTNSFTAIKDYSFTSIAMRQRQKQILALSAEKIDVVDYSRRDHSSITLTLDVALLPEIKERIKAFRRSLANFIVKNSNEVSDVYEIHIGLIPLTVNEKEKQLTN